MRLLLFNLATDVDDPILGFTTRWISSLAERVEFIHVMSMRVGRVDVPHNVRVYSVGKEKGYSEPRRALKFYRQLFHILNENTIDVCFSHMIPIFTILAAPVLRVKGIPIISWYAHRQVTVILKLAHHLSKQVVSISSGSYRYSHDKFVALGHGIDTRVFSPATSKKENEPMLLSVGRLSRIKDLTTLIEAIHLLRQRSYKVHCALVGGPTEQDRAYVQELRKSVLESGLEETVEFVGAVPNSQVVCWYRRCFAHINLCPTGALDKTALEAMACSKPSLVANEEFMGTLGTYSGQLLFRYADPKDLANKLSDLLDLHPPHRQKMGAYLRSRVLEMHSIEGLADQLVNVLKDTSKRLSDRS